MDVGCEGRMGGGGKLNRGQASAKLTFKVKEKVWPLFELCASEQF